jgi:hypothetical protein
MKDFKKQIGHHEFQLVSYQQERDCVGYVYVNFVHSDAKENIVTLDIETARDFHYSLGRVIAEYDKWEAKLK